MQIYHDTLPGGAKLTGYLRDAQSPFPTILSARRS